MTTTDHVQEQLEELIMMQRVDRELNATPSIENAMMLTMDWAVRRTGATRGVLAVLNAEGTGLVPILKLGYQQGKLDFNAEHPIPLDFRMFGKAATERQTIFIPRATDPETRKMLSEGSLSGMTVPIEMRERILGIIALESKQADAFTDRDLSFISRLAAKAAVPLDNSRLYQEAEHRADEMAALYTASRTISSSIERSEVLNNAAQAVAGVFSVSSVFIADYRHDLKRFNVTASYKLGTARDTPDRPPIVNTTIRVETVPELGPLVATQEKFVVSATDTTLSDGLRTFIDKHNILAMLVIPLTQKQFTVGAIFAIEGRRDRRFTKDEIFVADSLGSQISSALRQAKLYEDLRELENLKSEMIRMASHDLRNPLGNVMGYLELLISTFRGDESTDEREEYIAHIKQSLGVMRSLIEDLLTLERIESERQSSWMTFNLAKTLDEVIASQLPAAHQKRQEMNVQIHARDVNFIGSATQLRQAMVNFVNNAIKYTPDGGKIEVYFGVEQEAGKIHFHVQDNGYGISKERQARLFQRFYRAREAGTDHIPGTGLGLSLVKTVIERHGGEVFVTSERGVGSTFGFWLPIQRFKQVEAEGG